MLAKNSPISFVALLILIYFSGIPLLGWALHSHFDSIASVIDLTVGEIPFGNELYAMVLKCFAGITGQTISITDFQFDLTLGYILEESCKTLFVVMIYKLLNHYACSLMRLERAFGFWNKAKKTVVLLINSLIAALLAPIPIEFCFGQMNTLSENAAKICYVIVSMIVTSGAVGFFLALGLGVLAVVVIIFVVVYLLGALQLFLNYFFLLVILYAMENGIILLQFIGWAGLLSAAILIVLLTDLLDSVTS